MKNIKNNKKDGLPNIPGLWEHSKHGLCDVFLKLNEDNKTFSFHGCSKFGLFLVSETNSEDWYEMINE
jgi:hypothetical protein